MKIFLVYQVARPQETILIDCLGCFFRIVPVAQHDAVPLGAKLASLTRRQGIALLVGYLYFQMWVYLSDRF